jgi:tetratricopeptide (TPR) repeat protein
MGFYHSIRPREALPKARAAAEKALQLDDTLAEAHASLGNIDMNDWNWAAAEREFQRSIALNPGYVSAHHWYSLLLSALGRLEEAYAEIRRAQQLDPLSLIVNHNVGLQLYYARRYDEAIQQYRKTLEMDPGLRVTALMLLYTQAERGAFQEAIAAGERNLYNVRPNDPEEGWIKAALAYLHARAGDRRQAFRRVEEILETYRERSMGPENIAIAYVGLGERDKAFEWLDKAYEERTPFALFLKPSPFWDPLRADRRFADLLRRVGLPP